MDQQSEEKDVIVVEKIQTQNVMVSSVDLGIRYKCYKCGIKFYDLGKPQPLCPSCGANQLDGLIKAARKRKGKHRSAFVAKTEPHNIAPGENEELHEVVDELDSEFVLDVDDIVLEEHEDSDDKEKLREEYFMAKTTVAKKAVKKKPLKAAAAKAVKPKVVAKATKSKTAKKAVKPKTAVKAVKKKAK